MNVRESNRRGKMWLRAAKRKKLPDAYVGISDTDTLVTIGFLLCMVHAGGLINADHYFSRIYGNTTRGTPWEVI